MENSSRNVSRVAESRNASRVAESRNASKIHKNDSRNPSKVKDQPTKSLYNVREKPSIVDVKIVKDGVTKARSRDNSKLGKCKDFIKSNRDQVAAYCNHKLRKKSLLEKSKPRATSRSNQAALKSQRDNKAAKSKVSHSSKLENVKNRDLKNRLTQRPSLATSELSENTGFANTVTIWTQNPNLKSLKQIQKRQNKENMAQSFVETKRPKHRTQKSFIDLERV